MKRLLNPLDFPGKDPVFGKGRQNMESDLGEPSVNVPKSDVYFSCAYKSIPHALETIFLSCDTLDSVAIS